MVILPLPVPPETIRFIRARTARSRAEREPGTAHAGVPRHVRDGRELADREHRTAERKGGMIAWSGRRPFLANHPSRLEEVSFGGDVSAWRTLP
jgi:hypothetical protein